MSSRDFMVQKTKFFDSASFAVVKNVYPRILYVVGMI